MTVKWLIVFLFVSSTRLRFFIFGGSVPVSFPISLLFLCVADPFLL